MTEALDAVVLHTETTTSLFNRKKLTKDILLRYLNEKKVDVSGSADKLTLIDTIKSYWNSFQPNDYTDGLPANNACSSSGHTTVSSTGVIDHQAPSANIQEMALKFAQWFFEILAKVSNGTHTASIAEHFWSDSRLKATIRCSSAHNEESREVYGSEEVTSLAPMISRNFNRIQFLFCRL